MQQTDIEVHQALRAAGGEEQHHAADARTGYWQPGRLSTRTPAVCLCITWWASPQRRGTASTAAGP